MDRELHAIVSPAGPELFRAVGAALDGSGPAVLPLPSDLPVSALRATLDALRPTHVDGVRHPGGTGVAPEAAVVIATSGSTGVPEGRAALRRRPDAPPRRPPLRRLDARPGERWLCCLPPSHISGLQVLIRSLLGETEPIIHDGFSPEAVLASGADHVSLVPTQLRRLLHADLSVFRTILLGGAAAPAELLAAARAAGAGSSPRTA